MLRAVLDTNVIVSGVIAKKGIPFALLAAWRERQWNLVISQTIIREVHRVLALPKISRTYALGGQDIAALIHLLESRATVVPGRLTIARTARDIADDHILACAVEGQADYVVTGDQDLLALGRFEGIPILAPAAFSALLQASSA